MDAHYLTQLREIRLKIGAPRSAVATLTNIKPDRLRALEMGTAPRGPWFDEAVRLSHVLLQGEAILPMVAPKHSELNSRQIMEELGGQHTDRDIEFWRSGRRAPLHLAMRLAARFGLHDPIALDVSSVSMQVWDMIEAGDRSLEAPGFCPWCNVDRFPLEDGTQEPHADWCLPANIWSPRDGPDTVLAIEPIARRRRSHSMLARGLKAQRLKKGKTQVLAAAAMGVDPNHYARIERCELNLTLANADKLAEAWGIQSEELFNE